MDDIDILQEFEALADRLESSSREVAEVGSAEGALAYKGSASALRIAISQWRKRQERENSELNLEFGELILSEDDDEIAFQKVSEGSYRVISIPENLKKQVDFGEEE